MCILTQATQYTIKGDFMAIPKIKIIFFKFKRNFIPLIFCIFTILLVIFSRDNMQAAQNGLSLFANSVLPSLLPFFIATELLRSYQHNTLSRQMSKWNHETTFQCTRRRLICLFNGNYKPDILLVPKLYLV